MTRDGTERQGERAKKCIFIDKWNQWAVACFECNDNDDDDENDGRRQAMQFVSNISYTFMVWHTNVFACFYNNRLHWNSPLARYFQVEMHA